MPCGDDIVRASTPIRDGQETKAVEAWLRRDLARRYDPTLREPLPAEILALLNLTA